MGRKWFIAWHVLFFVVAGVLYFFCVLPRWYELMGEMPSGLGMAGRIASGALIGLAALPVVFVLLRTRKPELGTPQLALSIRVWSIVAHVLSGVLIIGTAISEIWVSLEAGGRYLFAVYGAAAAIGVLGFVAFYLSFVAEMPPPPPKPIKAKEPKQRRLRRRKKGAEDAADESAEATEAADSEDSEDTEDTGPDEPDELDEPDEPDESAVTAEAEQPEAEAEAPTEAAQVEPTEDAEEAPSGLRNRRPTGKGNHRMRRRRTRGGVALDD